MEIKNYSAYNEKEILKVYSSVGWTAYTDDPQALKVPRSPEDPAPVR